MAAARAKKPPTSSAWRKRSANQRRSGTTPAGTSRQGCWWRRCTTSTSVRVARRSALPSSTVERRASSASDASGPRACSISTVPSSSSAARTQAAPIPTTPAGRGNPRFLLDPGHLEHREAAVTDSGPGRGSCWGRPARADGPERPLLEVASGGPPRPPRPPAPPCPPPCVLTGRRRLRARPWSSKPANISSRPRGASSSNRLEAVGGLLRGLRRAGTARPRTRPARPRCRRGGRRSARPSSAPSSMARFAPSPANGDIRWAASPSRVTPGTRSQRCPIGSALMRRGATSGRRRRRSAPRSSGVPAGELLEQHGLGGSRCR